MNENRIIVEIRNNIDHEVALRCVASVVSHGKSSYGDEKPHYCWATTFDTSCGCVTVATRNYRKSNCFVVY